MNTTTTPGKLVEFFANSIPLRASVILVSGKAGTGKSTSAYILERILKEKGLIVWKTAFAKGVKEAAKNSFGWDEQKDDRGRKLLQGIGNLGRQYDPDCWVRQVFGKFLLEYLDEHVFDPDVIIIDDWRFPNEAEFLNDHEEYLVYKIKVIASEREILKGTPFYEDISEVSLDAYPEFDLVIENNGSMEDLYEKLAVFVDEHYKKE